MNALKTFLLMTGLFALFLAVGYMLGQYYGGVDYGTFYARRFMTYGFGMAIAVNLFGYFFGDKLVLLMYGAKLIDPAKEQRLHRVVQTLAVKANIPVPKLYKIDIGVPNAFATGRSPAHASVAVTEGLLKSLADDEIEGVIAHELSHVRHRDILIATIAATFAGAIMYLARMAEWAAIFGGGRSDNRESRGNPVVLIMVAILAPLAAFLIQMAISRSREYKADEGSANLTGRPLSLANALRKLDSVARRHPMPDANPATSHMFIVNPLSGGSILELFSTHPPMDKRVARLEAMAGEHAGFKVPKIVY